MEEIFEAIKQSAIEIKELIETGDTGKSANQNYLKQFVSKGFNSEASFTKYNFL